MSSLSQFVEDTTQCTDLREAVKIFLLETTNNRIDTFECPVCGEDLRQTYQQGLTIFRGNCNCCKLGIQFKHRIAHEIHAGCEVIVTYPVALADPDLRAKLRKAWVLKHGTTLVSQLAEDRKVDLDAWISEAQEIMHVHNQKRRPV